MSPMLAVSFFVVFFVTVQFLTLPLSHSSLWLVDLLSVDVMRKIATDMLSKFLWRQAWSRAEYRYVWKQPVGAWDWDNMWLDEYEVETIATMVMRGYLSAGVREIQEAAAALKLKRK